MNLCGCWFFSTIVCRAAPVRAVSSLVFTKHVFVVIGTCSGAREGEDLHRLHSLNLLSVFASLSFLKNSDVCVSLPVFHTHPHMHIRIHSDSPCSSAGEHDCRTSWTSLMKEKYINGKYNRSTIPGNAINSVRADTHTYFGPIKMESSGRN